MWTHLVSLFIMGWKSIIWLHRGCQLQTSSGSYTLKRERGTGTGTFTEVVKWCILLFFSSQHFFPSSHGSSECDTIKHHSKDYCGGLGGTCYAKWDPWTLHCMHLPGLFHDSQRSACRVNSLLLAVINSTISTQVPLHPLPQFYIVSKKRIY